jgi:hypothetical protein
METPYIFYSGVSKCVTRNCVTQMIGYAIKKNKCHQRDPEYPDIYLEYPGLLHRTQKNSKHNISYKSHTNEKVLKELEIRHLSSFKHRVAYITNCSHTT